MTGVEAIAELFAGPGARDYLGGAVAFSVRNSTAVNALSRTPRS